MEQTKGIYHATLHDSSLHFAAVLSDFYKMFIVFAVLLLHTFVFMISPEQQDRKPYALPVQCIPYTSLKHGVCRQLVNNIIIEMTKRGMKVAGLCNKTLILTCVSDCTFRVYIKWRV